MFKRISHLSCYLFILFYSVSSYCIMRESALPYVYSIISSVNPIVLCIYPIISFILLKKKLWVPWLMWIFCVHDRAYLIWIFFWENIKVWPNYTILCNFCETGLACVHKKLLGYVFYWELKCYTSVYPIITGILLSISVIINALHCHLLCAALSYNVEAWVMWACLLFLSFPFFF